MEQNILENRNEIKQIFKEAIFEFFEERRNFLQNEILNVLEDVAMYNAIKEGEKSDLIDEKEIFNTLGLNHDN